MSVKLGIDVLLSDRIELLKGKRVALLTHAAGVNSRLQPTLNLLHSHPDVNLTVLFGPEHGLYGIAQDMEGVGATHDGETGLEVKSLYGTDEKSLTPHDDDYQHFDVLVCDLQDVGSRYYTFIYTLALCLEGCAQHGKPVIVLDRPNPLNGVTVEGNILRRGFESFVGLYPLPVRHGMTIGELALYFNDTEGFGCELTVVAMQGWRREMYFDETGLNWIPPSPNMPHFETAILYPGMCLIESTELSEGRGTTMPFAWIGAPYIDPHKLAIRLNGLRLEGVVFGPVSFRPGYQKHQGEVCHGVHTHVTNRASLKPYATGLKLLQCLHDLYPNDFSWRAKPYEFVADIPAIDLLTGGDEYRIALEGRGDLDGFLKRCDDEEWGFLQRRREWLLY